MRSENKAIWNKLGSLSDICEDPTYARFTVYWNMILYSPKPLVEYWLVLVSPWNVTGKAVKHKQIENVGEGGWIGGGGGWIMKRGLSRRLEMS